MLHFTAAGLIFILLSAVFCIVNAVRSFVYQKESDKSITPLLITSERISLYMFITAIAGSMFLDIGYVFRIAEFEFTIGKLMMTGYIVIRLAHLLYFKKLGSYINTHRILFILLLIFIISMAAGYLYQTMIPSKVVILPTEVSLDAAYKDNSLLAYPKPGYFAMKGFFMIIAWALFCIFSADYFTDTSAMKYLRDTIFWCFIVLFIVQYIELAFNYIFGAFSFRPLIDYFFGIGDGTMDPFKPRFSIRNAYTLFKEPSHIGYVLTILYLIFFKIRTLRPLYVIVVVMSFPAAVISGSTTAVLLSLAGLLLMTVMVLNTLWKKNRKYFFIGILAAMTVVVFLAILFKPVLTEILYKILSSFSLAGSKQGRARNWSIFLAYRAFIYNPVFGVGVGVTKSTGLISSMFAALGLAGILLYLKFVISLIKPLMNKENLFVAAVLLFFLNFTFPEGTYYSPAFLGILFPLINLRNLDNIMSDNAAAAVR